MKTMRKRITICSLMRVQSINYLSQNITEVGFSLELERPIDIHTLGLGPHMNVLFPRQGSRKLHFPKLDLDGKIDWSDAHKPTVRHYSVKEYDPGKNVILMNFSNSMNGIGSQWAKKARLNDKLGLLTISSKCDYQDQYLVLIGDITSISSFHYILTHLPGTARGEVYLTVPSKSDICTLPKLPGFEVHWLVQADLCELLYAFKHLKSQKKGPILFWGGMEHSLVLSVRSYLNCPSALKQDNCQLISYWQLGKKKEELMRIKSE